VGAAIVAAASVAAGAGRVSAQDADELCAIAARVHGTFQGASGGLGVVSGDMTIPRFEVLNGSVTAIGRIVAAKFASKFLTTFLSALRLSLSFYNPSP